MITTDVSLIPRSFYNADATALTVSKSLADTVQSGVQAKFDKLPPVAKAEFLSQVANLAPGEVDTPQELTATLDRLDTAARNVSELASTVVAFVGDIAKFLGRAMIEFAGQQRQSALDDRMAARDAAKAQLLEQAKEMDQSADKMMTGAIVNAVVGGLSAAVSGISAGLSVAQQGSQIKTMTGAMAETKSGNKALSDMHGIDTDVAKGVKFDINANIATNKTKFDIAQAGSQRAMTSGQIGEAVGSGMKTVGGTTDASLQADAKHDDAQGARDAADATYQQQVGDQKKELQQAMDEMIKQLISFLKDMQENEVDAMRALTKV
ncbi:hypothetical protein ASG43_00025 [Aureimonas sp. Leaf454]|uniref:type III secretion system translocon subunit SctB n=1 Tax=Aureimonas sp. Leaf454 TaxID=1736381 RepID=UPI0006FDA7BC|nr:type III secretion system translocon subunit SctB [Aureimonas sp. Leaf454]KQT54068.1 hypothetical protein ASG43_00025 [Aureimonas sp. Leaf454]